MGLIFFLLLHQLELIMRIFGKDLLNLKYNKKNLIGLKKLAQKVK